MYLGIEIGGTKLQLGVSRSGDSAFDELRRLDVRPQLGAAGIREQIADVGQELVRLHQVRKIGIGFGGPVDAQLGRTIKSHQIEGWDDFPIRQWCEETLKVPAVLGNDCDVATLAEATKGAGRGFGTVFYVTVGTGVGGGCVVGGQLLGQSRPAIAEIGHLRPGLECDDPHATVESFASGWAIARTVRELVKTDKENLSGISQVAVDELLNVSKGDLKNLTAVAIAELARGGNRIAVASIDRACRALGWAVAQTVTLLAPDIVVIGGGVSLMGEQLFFEPVRRYARQYVFPPLADSFEIQPAQLGEEVVVHGAIALAAR